MYDIIFISVQEPNADENYKKLKSRFPTLKTAKDFESAQQKSLTKMFWVVWDDLCVLDEFDFSFIPEKRDQKYTHVFKNKDSYDGVILCPKNAEVSQKEIDYRFLVNRKEWDIVASKPKPYDVVFISYNEPNAEKNYQNLLKKVPDARRIHGVTGIHQAHIEAAKICSTDMIWIVDGDAEVLDDFDFDYQISRQEKDTVHVWRSRNPVNDLVYGYGGVKLFPRKLTLNMDVNKTDMTTSITDKFKLMSEISNITIFNTDPFNTWKSAFRECVKLSSRIIDRQKDNETDYRLKIWQTEGKDNLYGEYAIAGAIAGAKYGKKYQNSVEDLCKINDFNWLKDQFNANRS